MNSIVIPPYQYYVPDIIAIYKQIYLQISHVKVNDIGISQLHVILNYLSKVQGLVTAQVTDGASEMQQYKHSNVNYIDGGAGLKGGNCRETICLNINSNQHPSNNASNKAVLKSLPSRRGRKVIAGNREETFSIKRQELEANALSQAIQWQMRNGTSSTLEDLEEFLSSEEIDMIYSDLQYLYPGFDRPLQTTTIPSQELMVA